MSDWEAEVAETQTWIKFVVKSGYVEIESGRELYASYNKVLAGIVSMINNPSVWLIKK